MPDGASTSNVMERIRNARGFVFDLDGTLALGDPKGHGLRPLPGTQELLASLDRNGTPFVVFTNGTLRTPHETAQKLRDAGFPVSDEQAMTPSSVAAAYFAARKISPVLVLGCEAVWKPLVEAGVEVILEDEYQGGVKAVYVGWYREFTMVSIEKAFDAIMNGAPLYSASNVPFFASSKGRALGTSFAICAALRGLTKKPAIVLGKPSSQALKEASRKLGVPIHEMAIVGDDPLCEVRLAHYGDALAVGVTTGTASRAQFEAQTGNYRPDIVIDGLAELAQILQST